jgi:hypothetical protein
LNREVKGKRFAIWDLYFFKLTISSYISSDPVVVPSCRTRGFGDILEDVFLDGRMRFKFIGGSS